MRRTAKTAEPQTLAELTAGLDRETSWVAKYAGEAGDDQQQLMKAVLERQLEHERLSFVHFGRLFDAEVEGLREAGLSVKDAHELAMRILPRLIGADRPPQPIVPAGYQEALTALVEAMNALARNAERRIDIVHGDAPIFRTEDPS